MAKEKNDDLLVKSRVEQLDALELDSEILHVLKQQLMSAMQYLPLSLQDKWEPELDTCLQIAVLYLSLKGVGATFGQQLLNIRFLKPHRRTALFVVSIPILLKYLKARIAHSALKTNNRQLKHIIQFSSKWGEVSVSIGSFINLLFFLHSGHYPNLLYRIFGMQMEYTTSKSRQRQVGYTHMTRELIWHSFIELLVFILPLINYHYIKRQVLKVLMLGAQVPISRQGGTKQLSFTIKTLCAVCSHRPILPHNMECDHIFCYYCLQANILADPHFTCPQCGHRASGLSSVKSVHMSVL